MRAPRSLLLLAAAAVACRGAAPRQGGEGARGPAGASAPARPEDFSSERAWAELVTLCSFGPRAHGTSGWRRAQDHFRQRLTELGFQVEDQAFEHQGVRDPAPTGFVNVIGRWRPEAPVRVLIGSHYDTRLWADHDPDPRLRNEPIQGANDGGSGVAVMLELARVIAARPPAHGVDLVFFDGEDYGPEGSPDYFLGSRHLAAEWERDPAIVQPRVAIVRPRVAIVRPRVAIVRPRVAIVLDMVGDADLRFAREATAQHQVPWLNDQIWATGRRLGLGAHLSDDLRAVVDDHTALLQAGVPATLLIDFEYPHWHAAGDTLDKCSAESLGVTGRLVVAAVLGERLPGAR